MNQKHTLNIDIFKYIYINTLTIFFVKKETPLNMININI